MENEKKVLEEKFGKFIKIDENNVISLKRDNEFIPFADVKNLANEVENSQEKFNFSVKSFGEDFKESLKDEKSWENFEEKRVDEAFEEYFNSDFYKEFMAEQKALVESDYDGIDYDLADKIDNYPERQIDEWYAQQEANEIYDQQKSQYEEFEASQQYEQETLAYDYEQDKKLDNYIDNVQVDEWYKQQEALDDSSALDDLVTKYEKAESKEKPSIKELFKSAKKSIEVVEKAQESEQTQNRVSRGRDR